MKFSIVIPCYNAEAYLPKLFKSLKALIFDKEQWEVIFVDDGSRDQTFALLSEFAAQHQNFTAVTQANAGVSAARNHGTDLAVGDWIIYLDCDDWLNPNYLYEINKAMQEFPHASCYFANIARYYEGSKRSKILKNSCPHSLKKLYRQQQAKSKKESERDSAKQAAVFSLREFSFNFYRTSQRIAFKRAILNAFAIRFKVGLKYGEDMFFHWQYINALFQLEEGKPASQLAEQADLDRAQLQPLQACFVPEAIYYYFRSEDEALRVTDRRQTNQLASMFNTYLACYTLYQEFSFNPEAQLLYLRELMPHLGASLIYAIWDSGNLIRFAEETRLELAAYSLLYRKWLEAYQEHGLTKELIQATNKVAYYPQVRALPLFLFLLQVAQQPAAFAQFQRKLLACEPEQQNPSNQANQQASTASYQNNLLALQSIFARLSQVYPQTALLAEQWQADLVALAKLLSGVKNPAEKKSTNPIKQNWESTQPASDPISSQPKQDQAEHLLASPPAVVYYAAKYFASQNQLQILTNVALDSQARLVLAEFGTEFSENSVSDYQVFGISVGYLYCFSLAELKFSQLIKLVRFWVKQSGKSKLMARILLAIVQSQASKWLAGLASWFKAKDSSTKKTEALPQFKQTDLTQTEQSPTESAETEQTQTEQSEGEFAQEQSTKPETEQNYHHSASSAETSPSLELTRASTKIARQSALPQTLALYFSEQSKALLEQACSQAAQQGGVELRSAKVKAEASEKQGAELFSAELLLSRLASPDLILVEANTYLSKSGVAGLWRYYLNYPQTEILILTEEDFISRSKQQRFLQRDYPLTQFVVVRSKEQPCSPYLEALYASYPNLCLVEITQLSKS